MLKWSQMPMCMMSKHTLDEKCVIHFSRLLPGIRMATVAEYFFFLESDYPNIKHSFDIWHGSKNLGKKIIKVRN